MTVATKIESNRYTFQSMDHVGAHIDQLKAIEIFAQFEEPNYDYTYGMRSSEVAQRYKRIVSTAGDERHQMTLLHYDARTSKVEHIWTGTEDDTEVLLMLTRSQAYSWMRNLPKLVSQ